MCIYAYAYYGESAGLKAKERRRIQHGGTDGRRKCLYKARISLENTKYIFRQVRIELHDTLPHHIQYFTVFVQSFKYSLQFVIASIC
ncbi:hypothetical protein HanRHA438_Chr04g0172021 [Helianthus annuus]|nr:hypothetical protein HanRHA438_Chr04g0172021 [Helianthus annuus]